MQSSYSQKPAAAFAGMLADNGNTDVRSKIAQEAIPFGRLISRATEANHVRLPNVNEADVVFSGDLVTSNSVVGTITVTDKDGVETATTLTATVFATDHATTMAAIATKLDAVAGVESATVGGTSDRTITVAATDDYEIVLSAFVVTLGGSQATATYAHRTTDTPHGVAMHEHRVPAADSEAQYEHEDTVSVLQKGRIWVYSEATVTEGDPVYWRHKYSSSTKLKGQVRPDADSGTATLLSGVVFAEGRTGAGLVPIDLNLP